MRRARITYPENDNPYEWYFHGFASARNEVMAVLENIETGRLAEQPVRWVSLEPLLDGCTEREIQSQRKAHA